MKLVYGDLWDYKFEDRQIWRVITTNGTIKRNGENVMGSGCAKEWKDRNPEAPRWLARKLIHEGNLVHVFPDDHVVTFPTKHEWNQNSDLYLIRESSISLASLAEKLPDDIFVLPRPGVGAGKLSWKNVLPVIELILPDNVHVITWSE